MKELIKVVKENDRVTVLARDLHEFLEIGTLYKDWFPRMIEYGFIEGVDFNVLKNERVQIEGNREVSRIILDHQITVEMAKEISMIQRNEKGREARKYFIRCEEELKRQLPSTYKQALIELVAKIEETEQLEKEKELYKLEAQKATEENETLEIALNSSLKFYTVAKYNKVFHMGWNLKKCQVIGKGISAYCRCNSIEIRSCQTNDERFGKVNSYPITAWENFLK